LVFSLRGEGRGKPPKEQSIAGLRYVPDYLNDMEQEQFRTVVDGQPWLSDLKRRVQHYGYRYNYAHRGTGSANYLGPLPSWAASLTERLQRDGFIARTPDQLIVNEYLPGQGIAGHVDSVPCFGDTIFSLSLGSCCVMVFKHLGSPAVKELLLEPGSLLIMQDEARYDWKHGIPARKTDVYAGQTIERGRRLSLTLRSVTESSY
jgi:alkylated DNA repair dioxygenase AlkB